MFWLRQPSEQSIARFIAESTALPLSYAPVGIAAQLPDRFTVDETSVVVGAGADAFHRARRALQQWAHFDLGWVRIAPLSAPVEIGTIVAVVVHHLGFWSINGCRVVYLLADDPEREFGFAYGTLSNHAEKGEEIFQVTRSPRTNEVRYRIRAVSRPNALLAWCGYPVTRRIQARFRVDSGRAMQRAVMLRARREED
jgi:uncharacterized protein (UPF0548 family)